MATVKAFIRVSAKKKSDADVAVRFRVSDGRTVQLFHKSDIFVDPNVWDAKKECIKAKVLYNSKDRVKFDNSVSDRKNVLLTVYEAAEDKQHLTSESFEVLVDQYLHPEKYESLNEDKRNDFFFQFDRYLEIKNCPDTDIKNFYTMIRLLKRFEMYKRLNTGTEYKLDFKSMTVQTIRDIEKFVHDEYKIVKSPAFKQIYETIPEKRTPDVRSANTIAKFMKRLRTFIMWVLNEKLLEVDPYNGYEQKQAIYGTPYYLTIEERTKIAETDLYAAWEALPDEEKSITTKSFIAQLEKQRDIFVFQCMIGCRVGDLLKMTPKNVINGKISYIARKTVRDRVDPTEVPLNETARTILAKYWDGERMTGKLLPFISSQKYNDCIKVIFRLCGITRIVTVWNSTTGTEEQRPINELASSHLARRTFIGNLYKKVQDPNLIGKLSGHAEGSRAFARYRTIDDEMKQNLVDMLE